MNIQIGDIYRYHDKRISAIAVVTNIINDNVYYTIFNHPNKKFDNFSLFVDKHSFKNTYPYKLA